MTADGRRHQTSEPLRRQDTERALLNPASVFTTPEEVLTHPQLSRHERIDVLRRWEYDASELEVANEEGMVSQSEDDTLRRILLALAQLTDGTDIERAAPTKHGAVTVRTPKSTGR